MTDESRLAALREALDCLEAPTAHARGLPAFVYADTDWFEAERRTLFATTWFAVAFESDVPEIGDAVPVETAGWPLLLTRARDRRVRAFRNICPHRGMRLVDAPRKECGALTCPWHAWTFDLTGRLAATPNIGGPGVRTQEGFERVAHGLFEIRSDTWMGVVFVNMDSKAPPLTDHVRPLERRLSTFDFAVTAQAPDIAYEYDYACNWKIGVEGGIEDYHIPFVHPQLGPGGRFFPEFGGDDFVGNSSRRTVEVGKRRFLDPARPDLKPMPSFPHVPESGEVEASLIFLLFPNLFIATVLDHSTISIIVPQAADRTRYRRRFRFVEPAATAPEYAATRAEVLESWIGVTKQDGPIWSEVQRLMPTREEIGFRAVFSVHWEAAVQAFQAIVARKMLAAAPAETIARRAAE
jgi:choline monooxygenase